MLPVARTLLLADRDIVHAGVEVQRIAPIRSRAAYSQFVLKEPGHTSRLTTHWWCSGMVTLSTVMPWADEFWNYDYIGARWPHVQGEFRVGNGGFLRSKSCSTRCAMTRSSWVKTTRTKRSASVTIELFESKHGIVFCQ